jgi:hypothetical protein
MNIINTLVESKEYDLNEDEKKKLRSKLENTLMGICEM